MGALISARLYVMEWAMHTQIQTLAVHVFARRSLYAAMTSSLLAGVLLAIVIGLNAENRVKKGRQD